MDSLVFSTKQFVMWRKILKSHIYFPLSITTLARTLITHLSNLAGGKDGPLWTKNIAQIRYYRGLSFGPCHILIRRVGDVTTVESWWILRQRKKKNLKAVIKWSLERITSQDIPCQVKDIVMSNIQICLDGYFPGTSGPEFDGWDGQYVFKSCSTWLCSASSILPTWKRQPFQSVLKFRWIP